MLTLTRGIAPWSSRSRWSSGAQCALASDNTLRSSATRAAYRSASASTIVFSPRRSTVAAEPVRHRACRPVTASAAVSPTMNCSAMRLMFRRATRASRARPNGTLSAASTPRSSTFGMATPSKYSERWRATSVFPSRAGNTSTKRNSCVLKAGRAIAQSSMRSLHQDMRNTLDRSVEPSSANSRARAAASRSSAGVTARRYPPALRKTQHPRHTVIATGGVAAVDDDRLTADERRISGEEEGGRGRDLVRPSESAQGVLADDLFPRSFHAGPEDHLGHRGVDESGADGVGADAARAVVDGHVLGEQDDPTLGCVVRRPARGALDAFDAGDRHDRTALAVDLFLFEHPGDGVLADEERPSEVDREYAFPLGGVDE